jgi:hypothetical protein
VTTVAGATAVKPDGVTVHEDQITLIGTHPKTVKPGDKFTIIGSGLFDAAELTPAGTPVKDAKGPIITLDAGAGAGSVECSYPNGAPSLSDNNSHIAVTVPADTAAGNYNVTVQRNGLTAPGRENGRVRIEIKP